MSNWKHQRQQSYFFEMRKFHNQIKNEIYNKYTPNQSILEIACGKGADLGRLYKNNVKQVIGYDIDKNSIIEANSRLLKYPVDFQKKVLLSVKDLSTEIIEGNGDFDVVSCMFALHYFFKTEETFNCVIKSIKNNLKIGGIFIATLFDGDHVKRRLTFPFNDETHFNIKLVDQGSRQPTPFGNTINVSIKDNFKTNTEANYNPDNEYIVDYADFVNLMKYNGFDLLESKLFNTYNYTKFKLTETDKDISFLNRMYVFVKK